MGPFYGLDWFFMLELDGFSTLPEPSSPIQNVHISIPESVPGPAGKLPSVAPRNMF